MLHQELGSFFTSAFVGFEIDIDLHVGDDIEAVDVTALIKHSGIIRFEEDDVRAGRHRLELQCACDLIETGIDKHECLIHPDVRGNP